MLVTTISAPRVVERSVPTGLRDLPIAASRTGPARSAAAVTQVSVGRPADATTVYGDPRATGPERVWASPVESDDPVSALMARNRSQWSYDLRDQWRGLGGALLRRLADTGENYSQTLADTASLSPLQPLDGEGPQDQAQRAEDLVTQQMTALSAVATNAPNASLKIQTRSGQTVELKIAVNAGMNGVTGMQVAIKSSGTLSEEERGAIAQLSDGLDQALEGLGRQDQAVLDLSGLMNFDRDVLSGLDMEVTNPMPGTAMDRFSLHLGDEKWTVALKGSDGALNLSVDPAKRSAGVKTPTPTNAQAQAQALQQALDRFDRAGERGRASAALVTQMKMAFTTLQGVASTTGADEAEALRTTASPGAAPQDDEASFLSGLTDFQASLTGDTFRTNRWGTTHEAGTLQYQLSQKTDDTASPEGRRRVVQTLSEQLSADYRRAPGDGMLDVRSGNFSETSIRDQSTVTTLIDATKPGSARVLRRTEAQERETVTDFQNHRQTSQRVSPNQGKLIERLR